MGIVQVEQNRLRQQEIEVRALVALLEHGNHYYSKQAERRLFEIAIDGSNKMQPNSLECTTPPVSNSLS